MNQELETLVEKWLYEEHKAACQDNYPHDWKGASRALLQFLSNHGVVRLDPDQTLPELRQEIDAAFQSLLGSPMRLPRHMEITEISINGMLKAAGWVKALPLIEKEGE
jgi:hypothetical protein